MNICEQYDGPERTEALKIAVLPARGAGDHLGKAVVVLTGGKVQPCWLCNQVRAIGNAIVPYNGVQS